MSNQNLTSFFVGQVDVSPNDIRISCNDTFQQITTAGYLSPYILQGYNIEDGDFVFVSSSQANASGLYRVSMPAKIPTLLPSFNNSQITTSLNDVSVSGEIVSLTAAEDLVFGNVCYINTSGTIAKADANVSGKFPAQFMAAQTISSGSNGTFLINGMARNDAWSWTVGGTLYLSITAGGITQTAPSSTDDCIQVLGFAIAANKIFLNPSVNYITHT